MGYRRLDDLLDVAHQRYWVLLRCRCGHEARENPMHLVMLLAKKRRSTKLRDLHKSMKCIHCGSREFTAEHCEAPDMWRG